MNHVIAYELLSGELAEYRNIAYEDVRQLIGEEKSRLVRGKDGVDYNLLATARWRCDDDGDIRVKVSIAEANWGSPHDELNDTIVISPPNSFEITPSVGIG